MAGAALPSVKVYELFTRTRAGEHGVDAAPIRAKEPHGVSQQLRLVTLERVVVPAGANGGD